MQLNSSDLPASWIEAIEQMARPLSQKEQRELTEAVFPEARDIAAAQTPEERDLCVQQLNKRLGLDSPGETFQKPFCAPQDSAPLAQ